MCKQVHETRKRLHQNILAHQHPLMRKWRQPDPQNNKPAKPHDFRWDSQPKKQQQPCPLVRINTIYLHSSCPQAWLKPKQTIKTNQMSGKNTLHRQTQRQVTAGTESYVQSNKIGSQVSKINTTTRMETSKLKAQFAIRLPWNKFRGKVG